MEDTRVPLDQQRCERTNPQTGLMEQLPALHPAWCSDIQFLPYMAPRWDDEGRVDPLWVEAIEVIDSDLHWLLQQPHQQFWCQVLYDKTLHILLDSYLHAAPRRHEDQPAVLPLGARDTLRNVHRRVFMVFLRMSTLKETADHTLSPEVFASILYEHFLFDIPKLLDLCVLYGSANLPLLSKMVANVFEKQPKYRDDLKSSMDSMLKLLDRVSAKCRGHEGEEDGEHALRLKETKTLEPVELVDLLLYIADIGATLRSFITVYKPAAAILLETNLIERICCFYEATIPTLQTQWHSIKHSINNPVYVKTRFRQAKQDLAWVVHSLLTTYYSAGMRGGGGGGGEKEEVPLRSPAGGSHVDGFLSAVSTILSEKAFLREFEKHYSLSECVFQMQRSFPTLDETHFNYVLSALGVPKGAVDTTAVGGASAQATPITPDEVKSPVSQVKDLLPHLGEGFIQACLKEYGNSAEAVVSHVLDGSLSPALLQLDQTMPGRLPSSTGNQGGETPQLQRGGTDMLETGASLLEQRASVFDNDEFDVLRREDIDFSRVHIGKRFDGSLNPSSLLDDKSHLDATRDLYKAYEYGGSYGYQEEGEREGQGEELPFLFEYDQYNDEYDDTYDSHNVGAADQVSADDLFTVKRLNQKGLYRRQMDSSDEEKERDETEVPGLKPFQPSLSGPVTLLKRGGSPAGQENRTKLETKIHQSKFGRGDPAIGSRGKPRAETQTRGDTSGTRTSETRMRQSNERHKGSRANHNRKNMADRKRNKGFGIPPRN